ncbi:hypothetical protein C8J57DRAFT_1421422 [Mycena rebaudengoi]|nr:hypothetical protein C8J57DRAFT_1421422 [Mycena rebaudengoi]
MGIVISFLASLATLGFRLNKQLFNYALVHSVWFGDLEAGATLASQEKKWFGDVPPDERAAFDNICTTSFLDALKNCYADELAQGPTIAAPFIRELNDAAAAGGEEAVADIALNAAQLFREEQKLIYTHYDCLARCVLRHVLDTVPRVDLHTKYLARPVYRLWLYMPLMHSEFLEDHKTYEGLVGRLVEELSSKKGGDAAELAYAKMQLEFPYRNEVLGRKTTKEEQKWLDEGGGTFESEK